MPVDVKDLLYLTINEIGKEKIRTEVASNVDACEKYCVEIISKCRRKLGSDPKDEVLATLCEALLHFMLTASLLPSERKVKIRDIEIDVVIPSTRTLTKSPEKSLVIQIVRKNDVAAKIKQAESVQPNNNNIWLISASPAQVTQRNYHLGSGSFSYMRIFSDINAFLMEKGQGGLKLLHGQ